MNNYYRLPLRNKILYSFGQFGVTIPTFFISSYLFIFYAPTAKSYIVAPYLVGIAFFLGTLIQAVANPFIGNWSDRSQSRFGRRRLFILTGFVPLTIFFALIWFPLYNEILDAISLFIYMVGFNFLYAYVVAPYLALIPEISTESKDRVRLTTISAYFSIIGIILASLIPPIMLFMHFNLSHISIVLSILVILAFGVVFLSIKESPKNKKIPTEYSIATAFIKTFKNQTFTRYIIAYLFFQFGFYFFLASLGYYVEYIVLPGYSNYKSYIGIFTLIAVLFTILFSPLLVRYSDRKGEKKAFILFTTLLGIGMILTFFVGFYSGTSNTIQMVLVMIFAAIGLTSYFILPNAIISEIIDEDELLTGYRREAMYFGVQGLLERIPSALAGLALGFWISDVFGATQNVLYIRLLGIIGGASILITALLFNFVPLKENVLRKREESND